MTAYDIATLFPTELLGLPSVQPPAARPLAAALDGIATHVMAAVQTLVAASPAARLIRLPPGPPPPSQGSQPGLPGSQPTPATAYQ